MTVIHSYGVIPLKKENSRWYVLLVLHKQGFHWSFPKGKAEQGETPLETAQREFKEETGLTIDKLLSKEPLAESYSFRRGSVKVIKHVAYYIALVVGTIQLQEEEIAEAKWVPLEEAIQHVSFKEAKKMCEKVLELVTQLGA